LEINTESPYKSYMESLLNEMEGGKASHGKPIEVAKLAAQIASQQKSPDLRYPIGAGVKSMLRLKNLLPWKLLESIILKRLKP
jgi:hypothetical protein